jgi:excisionase family DNA binding protein
MIQQAQTTASTTPHGSLLVDIQGAAAVLGLSPWQIRGLISNRELSVVKVGRKFYFRRTALLRWAERAEEVR